MPERDLTSLYQLVDMSVMLWKTVQDSALIAVQPMTLIDTVLHRTAQIEYGNGLPLLARHRHFFLFYLMTAGQPHFAYSLKEKWRDEKKDGPLQGDSLQEKLEKNRFDPEQWTQRQKPF